MKNTAMALIEQEEVGTERAKRRSKRPRENQHIRVRKWVERMLKESESVVEFSHDTLAVIDLEYGFRLVSPGFLEQLGLSRDDVLGHSISEVFGREFFEGVVKVKLDECFRGDVVQFEMKTHLAKLGDRDTLVSYFPIEGLQGVDRAAWVLQDITERKSLEGQT